MRQGVFVSYDITGRTRHIRSDEGRGQSYPAVKACAVHARVRYPQRNLVQTQPSPLSLLSLLPYCFALDVPFLCACLVFSVTVCATCAFAFRYVGAFSHGLDL